MILKHSGIILLVMSFFISPFLANADENKGYFSEEGSYPLNFDAIARELITTAEPHCRDELLTREFQLYLDLIESHETYLTSLSRIKARIAEFDDTLRSGVNGLWNEQCAIRGATLTQQRAERKVIQENTATMILVPVELADGVILKVRLSVIEKFPGLHAAYSSKFRDGNGKIQLQETPTICVAPLAARNIFGSSAVFVGKLLRKTRTATALTSYFP